MSMIIYKKYFTIFFLGLGYLQAMDQGSQYQRVKRVREEETHQANLQSAEQVNKILSDIKRNKKNEPVFGTPEVVALSKALQLTQFTPGNTKGKIAESIITTAVGSVDGSPVTKNNNLGNFYQSDSKAAKLVGEVSKYIRSPEGIKYTFVDLRHVMHPEVFYEDNDKSIKNVSGGHSYQQYVNRGLFADEAFVGQDNKTLGLLVGGKIAKTMLPIITEQDIIHRAHTGVTLAKNPDNKNAKISKSEEGSYFCTLKRHDNSLQHGSQFPVLVVDGDKINSDGKIYVGKFQNINSFNSPLSSNSLSSLSSSSSTSSSKASRPLKNSELLSSSKLSKSHKLNSATSGSLKLLSPTEKTIYISPGNFQSMMKQGKSWNSEVGGISVVDITEPLEQYCAKDLKSMGMIKFPGSVFGIQNCRDCLNNNANV